MIDFSKDFWLISDTHFFHNKIGIYCGRPDNWQELIINNWQSLIKPDDQVLHLGDYALGLFKDIENLTKELPGNITLVQGNHDRRSKSVFTSMGIDLIKSPIRYYNIIFSHRPIELSRNTFNIHGHIHEKENIDYKHINVSVERMGYKPILFSELIHDDYLKGG